MHDRHRPSPRTRTPAHPLTPPDPNTQPAGAADRGLAAALRDPAGFEATLPQNIRACGLRRSRYRGLPRTHVQHVLTTLACNLTRVADWIAEPTRVPCNRMCGRNQPYAPSP
ncbi:transposase [Streptomyces sp. NPDC058691]|uniref:transposase n=1 Tax=Streptomyces sp. NPDC058691 TaxID=3346601 RepID=UPI003654EB71